MYACCQHFLVNVITILNVGISIPMNKDVGHSTMVDVAETIITSNRNMIVLIDANIKEVHLLHQKLNSNQVFILHIILLGI
jgi:hypothetical protein